MASTRRLWLPWSRSFVAKQQRFLQLHHPSDDHFRKRREEKRIEEKRKGGVSSSTPVRKKSPAKLQNVLAAER
jgi:hypothetical protein